jgi:hypothetical protein
VIYVVGITLPAAVVGLLLLRETVGEAGTG